MLILFSIFALVLLIEGSPIKRDGCPPYPKNCTTSCVGIAPNGCVICQCNTGSGSSGNNTISTSGIKQIGTSCPAYPRNCKNAAIDSMGCVVCTGSSTQQSSLIGSGTSTSEKGEATQTGTGCPAFPKNCPMACVSLDSMGCVLCHCNNSTGSATTSLSSNGNGYQAAGSQGSGGCPAFDVRSCDTRCIEMDARGCLSCHCPPSTTLGPATSGKGIGTGSVIQLQNGPGCAPFNQNSCQQSCIKVDSDRCLICDCSNSSGSVSTNTGSQTSGCADFDLRSCNPSCVTTDVKGCLSCVCPKNTGSSNNTGTGSNTGNTGGQSSGGCPPFDLSSCDPNCIGMDTNGCLSCTCPPTTATPTGSNSSSTGNQTPVNQGSGGCPPFDVSTCDMSCVAMDANGCLHCQCTSSQVSGATAGTTQAPNSGGCPPFDVSKCDMKCVAMDTNGCLSCSCLPSTAAPNGTTQATSNGGKQGSGGCPPFDVSTCDMNCVAMDANGCLSCNCPPPSTGSTGSTVAPTSGSGSGAGGCPPFDVSSCDMSCVAMDANGCLSCTCQPTTVASSGSTMAATSAPGSGGCPPFDVSTCDMACVVMDTNGCLSCHCSASTASVSLTTTASPSGSGSQSSGGQSAGGCPPFDASLCEMSCIIMDSKGCLHCQCPATTASPGNGSGSTTVPSGTTSGQSAGGCPAFDASACDMSCIIMDSNGCLSCHCQTTTAFTHAPVTVPVLTTAPPSGSGNNGGCPTFDANTCDLRCTKMDAQGCLHCDCSGTNNTSTNIGTLGNNLGGTSSNNGGCPQLTPGCSTSCLHIDSTGCVICSCKATTMAPKLTVTTIPTTHAQTTTVLSSTCPPLRCIAPCNIGITFGPDNCPICKCKK